MTVPEPLGTVTVSLGLHALSDLVGAREVLAKGNTVEEVIHYLAETYPGMREKILAPGGEFLGHLMVVGPFKSSPCWRHIPHPCYPSGGLKALKFLPIPCGG